MRQSRFRPQLTPISDVLKGRRIELRPLQSDDFKQWSEVRNANVDWLTQW